MDKYELRKIVSKELEIPEEKLVWSNYSLNPKTLHHHEDGTIKGETGYWVVR